MIAFGLVYDNKEGVLCNVYINVNLFNGRNLTMSGGAHAVQQQGYIIVYKTQLTNLSPNKLNNISLMCQSLCVLCCVSRTLLVIYYETF